MIPKTAFVLFNSGAFGGAEKRFAGLFKWLNAAHPESFYFFINSHTLNQINRAFPDYPSDNIRIIDSPNIKGESNATADSDSPIIYNDIIPDPLEVNKNTSWLRKIYWFQKNKSRQRHLYNKIDEYRKSLGIEVFIGIFAGVLPLVYYFHQDFWQPAVIFSDMDSWFSEVHADMKKLWYRKYYSFNYALENSDMVDFLSPFILEGVRKRNVKIADSNVSITLCSFTDYSKCSIGNKDEFRIAFSGRLEPDKNPMLFLEAAAEILKEYPDVKFNLLGEGSLAGEIKSYIELNGLGGNIDFRFLPNPPEIFASTSVLVSLQTGTNYPSQSILEAMACGNAVIASNAGDTGLLVNESNGLLCELNLDSVVRSIKFLIENKDKARSLGISGRDFVMKEHTIEKCAEYYIDLIIKTRGKTLGK